MLIDFISLIFPNLCAACGGGLLKNESIICSRCEYGLPQTNFHFQKENPLEKMFYGRANVFSASAFYYFSKESKVQQLIHQLKYNGQQNVGHYIGRLYGQELQKSERFKTVNTILPVPLHYTKQKMRGYNQSECFAKGLADSMSIEVDFESLVRIKQTNSQTRKSRYERWENVDNVFKLKNKLHLENKHLLLVDDVVTTGATLEACLNLLKEVENVKLSIATIAYAND